MHSRSVVGIAFCISILFSFETVARAQQIVYEKTKLVAADSGDYDSFGFSLAAHGNRVAIGSLYNDASAVDCGSVYVYERHALGFWIQSAKLNTNPTTTLDQFGFAVAIEGNRLVVGSPGIDGASTESGAAFVFEADLDGNWVEVAKIFSGNGAPNDRFGVAVALDGDRIVVGASGTDSPYNSGSAYVFDRQANGVWQQMAQLKAQGASDSDYFGNALALQGSRIVVGTSQTDQPGNSGSAFVFERQPNGAWRQMAHLKASDAQTDDWFGSSVAMDGNRLAVGAMGVATPMHFNAGAVYVFERDAHAVWQESAKLTVSDFGGTTIGRSVAMQGDRILSGAAGWALPNQGSGAAYLFRRTSNGEWKQAAQLRSDASAYGDWFGMAVAMDGDLLAIGAMKDDAVAVDAGAVYLFDTFLHSRIPWK